MSNFEEQATAIVLSMNSAPWSREEAIKQLVELHQSDMLRIVEAAIPDRYPPKDWKPSTLYDDGYKLGVDQYYKSLINHIKERKSDERSKPATL